MRSLLLLAALTSGSAWARPVVLPLQGQLADAGGVPVDGSIDVTFRLYGSPARGAPLHLETVNVEFDQGDFTIYLGSSALLDSGLFNLDQEVWLGIQIAGDVEMELIRVGWTPLAAFAAHAGDAESLDGYGSADFLPADYRPNWSDIQNRPPGLDDGDNIGGGAGGTTYTIGQGLLQNGDELSVDPLAIYGWAEQVCYDSVTELRQSLDGVYLPQGWQPAWTDVTGKPAGFADNVDNDTTYQAGDGLALTGTLFSVDFADIDARVRAVCFDTEAELHAVLDADYLAADYVPAWSSISGVPAGFADGVDDGGLSYRAGAGVLITGDTISADSAYIRTQAAAVCFDDEAELHAVLDDDYLPADYAPSWVDLTNVPAGFADGVDDGGLSYRAGAGVMIDGDMISADSAYIRTQATAVCFDNEGELRATLDDVYLGADYTPAWGELTGVPAGFADGIDNGTTYTAGEGVSIVGTTISADAAFVQDQARAVSYDSEGELLAVLNDNYLPTSYVPAWSGLSGKPAGFADDVDNDAFGALACGDGLSPIRSGASWTCADLRVSMADPVDLQIALAGVDLELGAGTTIDGVPLGDSTYTDDDAVAAVAAAVPELRVRPRNPLMIFEPTMDACRTIYSDYGGMIRFPTRFANTPSVMMSIDESIDNSGASWSYADRVGRDRWYHQCNVQADAGAYLAMDRGIFRVDGKKIEAGFVPTARTNDTVFFPELFDVAPIVLVYPEGANAWVRVIGSSQVSTGGFQVQVNTNDKSLHWIAMEPGVYNYGSYHWEAVKLADPDNNDRFNFISSFQSLPSLLFTIGDTNSSGANYVRLIDVTQNDFQIYTNDNNSEVLYYVAFEEDF